MAEVGFFPQDGDNFIHVSAMTAHRNLQVLCSTTRPPRAVFYWSPRIRRRGQLTREFHQVVGEGEGGSKIGTVVNKCMVLS